MIKGFYCTLGSLHNFANFGVGKMLNKFQNKPSDLALAPLETLTGRELEVFDLIGRGMVSADIARQLHVSIKTIGTHKERIKEKLGVKHSAELVRYAVLWVEKEGAK